MRRTVGLFIVVSWLTLGWYQWQGWRHRPSVSAEPSAAAATITLTEAEVAKHASRADCWISIGGEVYDVTRFLNSHPGGASQILPDCGKDGSRGFTTQDRGRAHSPTARQLLADYHLGALGSQRSASSPAPTEPAPANSVGNDDEDEQEDERERESNKGRGR